MTFKHDGGGPRAARPDFFNVAADVKKAELPTRGKLEIEYERGPDGSFRVSALQEVTDGDGLSGALHGLAIQLYKRRDAYARLADEELSEAGKSIRFALRALLGDKEPKGNTR